MPHHKLRTADATRLIIVVGALIVGACATTPANVDVGDVYESLMQRTGMWDQLAAVGATMQLRLLRQNPQLQQTDAGRRLYDQVAIAYAPKEMRVATRNQLATKLAAEDAMEALKWYSTDLGKRIAVLESAPPAEVRRMEDASATLVAGLSPERKALIDRFMRVEKQPERAASLEETTLLATLRGINLNLPPDKKIDIAKAEAAIAARRSEAAENMRPSVYGLIASIYAPLSDREFEEYIVHEETPPAPRRTAAMLDAFRYALAEGGVRFGAAVSLQPDWQQKYPRGLLGS